ncbi:Rrf2 family transcriptional regulator [uncultured Clostridium sp.]|uniref:RrF2 family transcriptional regulator n=1 Tax=uncultured Clostridium sp. TaxID=59620 RepID=UPI002620DEC0|nr:Rrf2 family transcriptional regulator [uncultured Clostridium sp.]
MQLSKFTDYAFRALIYLAKNQSENCTVDKLADELNISTHHLKKVINKLAKTEYIISTKGRNGGLKLGLLPEEINLGKVLLLTEENLSLVECMHKSGVCPLINNDCKLKNIICKSLNEFLKEMSNFTLRDII